MIPCSRISDSVRVCESAVTQSKDCPLWQPTERGREMWDLEAHIFKKPMEGNAENTSSPSLTQSRARNLCEVVYVVCENVPWVLACVLWHVCVWNHLFSAVGMSQRRAARMASVLPPRSSRSLTPSSCHFHSFSYLPLSSLPSVSRLFPLFVTHVFCLMTLRNVHKVMCTSKGILD